MPYADPERNKAYWREYGKQNRKRRLVSYRDRFKKDPDKYKAMRRKTYLTHRTENLAKDKLYYLANLDAVRARSKVYRTKHRDHLSAQKREHRQENLEEYRRKDRERHKRDKEKRLLMMKAYYAKNYARFIGKVLRRRGKIKLQTEDSWQAINEFYNWVRLSVTVMCHWCGTTIIHSEREVDHKIPLAKGGRHAVKNLVPACKKCNREKHAMLPADFQLTRQTA